MSMRHIPSSGYLVPAAQLKAALPAEKQAEFEEVLDQGVLEIQAWLDEHWPQYLPSIEELWQPTLEDEIPEGIEVDQIYAIFDQASLYNQTFTAAHLRLQEAGINPFAANWAVWG